MKKEGERYGHNRIVQDVGIGSTYVGKLHADGETK